LVMIARRASGDAASLLARAKVATGSRYAAVRS
jgi:hypothetical protein